MVEGRQSGAIGLESLPPFSSVQDGIYALGEAHILQHKITFQLVSKITSGSAKATEKNSALNALGN